MAARFDAFPPEAQWRRAATHAVHARGLPVRSAEIVQIEPGDPTFLSQRAACRDTLISRLRVTPKLSATVEGGRDWMGLMAPLRWRGDYVFNGLEARPGDAFLASGRTGYQSIGAERDVVMMALCRPRLVLACASAAGVDPEDIRLDEGRLKDAGFASRGVGRAILSAIAASDGAGAADGPMVYSQAVETDLVDAVAAAIRARAAVSRTGRDGGDPRRIVFAAIDAVHDCGIDRAGISDMCAGADVGRTRLHECFVWVHGVSPGRYLRLMRLCRAREMLLDAEAPPRSVKDVAFGLGFTNTGRFAAAYQMMFGALPSAVLSRER